MPKPPRRPPGKRPGKGRQGHGMDPLFPEIKKGGQARKGPGKKAKPVKSKTKLQETRDRALGRAFKIKREIHLLANKKMISLQQANEIERRAGQIISLYKQRRLTEKEANAFLNSTAHWIEYLSKK